MRPKPDKDGVVHYHLWRELNFDARDQVRQERLTDAVLKRSLASEKQIEFALGLLKSRGFSINQTDDRFELFGFPVEPGNSVNCWLANLSKREISVVIDDLKSRPMEFDLWD